MGKSILYFSCPDRTTISGWCLQVTGRLTAQLTLFCPFIQNNRLFPSSTESGSKPYLQVASTQGFFTSQGDSWEERCANGIQALRRNNPDPTHHPCEPDTHRGREQGRLVSSIFMPFCSRAQPILSLKTVISFIFLVSKILRQLIY